MTSEQLKRLVLPERYQVIICLLAAMTIISISLGDLIYDKFLGDSILNTPEARSIYLGELGRLSEVPVVRTGVIVLFWGSVGLGAYIVYLGISNALTEARNEVVIETAYTNRGSLVKVFARVVPQLIAAVAMIGYLFVATRVLLPGFLGWAAGGILALPQPTAIIQTFAGLTGMAAAIYAAWTLIQLTFALE